jgi:dTDP-4-dehydrorhamnose reductase
MKGPLVVLGGSGLLGQAVQREAARRGLPAVAVSRRTGTDLTDPVALRALLQKLRPSQVVNAAAITSLPWCERHPAAAHALHAQLPEQLALWCAQQGVPWVQVSTDHYFSGACNRLHAEDAPVSPPNVYAASKLRGERKALQHGAGLALVLRTNIVGRRGWPGQPSFAEWAVDALRAGRAIDAYDDVWASSLDVGHFASAMFELTEQGARGLLNLAASQSASKAEFLQTLADALQLDTRHLHVCHRPDPAPDGVPRANTLGLDVTRAQSLLGRILPTTRQVAAALARSFEESPHDEHAITQ